MVAVNISILNIITANIYWPFSCTLLKALRKGDYVYLKNKIDSAESATENKSGMTMDLWGPQKSGSFILCQWCREDRSMRIYLERWRPSPVTWNRAFTSTVMSEHSWGRWMCEGEVNVEVNGRKGVRGTCCKFLLIMKHEYDTRMVKTPTDRCICRPSSQRCYF